MSPTRPFLPPSITRAWRLQRRSAAAAALIVTTLALALGSGTAVFTVADALLFRAVPFDDPGRLVRVSAGFPRIGLSGMGLSGPEAVELAELTRSFASVGPLTFSGPTVQAGAQSLPVSGIEISSGAANALRLRPAVGGLFTEADYSIGAPPVVVLGHGLWTRTFGRDPAVVGRSILVSGTPHRVIGVLPPGVGLLNRVPDIWRPLAVSRGNAGSRSDHRFTVIGRVSAPATERDAAADVERAVATWLEETGEMHSPSSQMHPLAVQSLTRATTGLNRDPIAALVVAVAFVLLIACANISTLLVARAEQRRVDLAVQWALGATWRRLAVDSLTEGLLLAAVGGAAGLAVAAGVIHVLQSLWPVLASLELSLDLRVVTAAAALTATAGTVIGLLPVVQIQGARASGWLQAGGRARSGGPGRLRLQRVLIGAQVALALLLSSGAGLMLRSLQALASVDTGIRTEGVLHTRVSLPDGTFRADEQVWQFYEQVLARVRSAHGVSSVAVMSGLPPLRPANNTSFLLDGVETIDHTSIRQVQFVQHVAGDYLGTLGIQLREGRALTAADDERAAPVALVNETLAKQFWPNESAIGRTLRPAGIGTWFTVAGVVADVRQAGLRAQPGTEIYVTHRQARLLLSGYLPTTMHVIVRGAGDPSALAAPVRYAVQQTHAAAALSPSTEMDEVVMRTVAQPRLLAWVFGAFAMLALLIAAVGVYAVTSYAVGTRTAEFGVRMALGARPRDILLLVAGGGTLHTAAGVVAGLCGAVAGTRLLRGLLFGVEPLDPMSLAAAAFVIALAAAAATLVPAARAARVDPLSALRE